MGEERRSWFDPMMLLGYAVLGLIVYLWVGEFRTTSMWGGATQGISGGKR